MEHLENAKYLLVDAQDHLQTYQRNAPTQHVAGVQKALHKMTQALILLEDLPSTKEVEPG